MANDDFREVGRNAAPEAMIVLGQDTYQDFQYARNAENSILIGLGAYVHALFGTPIYYDSMANLDECLLIRTEDGIKCITKERAEVFNISFKNRTLTIQPDKTFSLHRNGVQKSDGLAMGANDLILIKKIENWLRSFNPENAHIRTAVSLFPARKLPTNNKAAQPNNSDSQPNNSIVSVPQVAAQAAVR